jgi:hypothetical protein
MEKQEIIEVAKNLNFILDNDKFDDKEYFGESNNLRYLRFVSNDNELDEKDLRWIWYKNDSDKDNLNRGLYLQKRLLKKRQILNSLKY